MISGGSGRAIQSWQDYVAGTEPMNPADIFHAMITMSYDVPIVTWTPNLNTNGKVRMYTVLGKTNLTDAAWPPTNAVHGFFKERWRCRRRRSRGECAARMAALHTAATSAAAGG